MDSYLQYGYGSHQCLGHDISTLGMTTMLKVVGRLNNLRRAPGPQGMMKQVVLDNGFKQYMSEGCECWSPVPTSLKVNWDGDLYGFDGVSEEEDSGTAKPAEEGTKPNSNGTAISNGTATSNGSTKAHANGNGNSKRPGSVLLKTPGAEKKVAASESSDATTEGM